MPDKEMKGVSCSYPYDGYVLYNTPPMKDGRARVHLYNPRTRNRYWLTLAKYRLEVSLGRFLLPGEEADHRDGNGLNDSLDNLQVLSKAENNAKKREQLGIARTFRELICPVCTTAFSRPANRVDFKIKSGHIPTCSRVCGGKYAHRAVQGSNP